MRQDGAFISESRLVVDFHRFFRAYICIYVIDLFAQMTKAVEDAIRECGMGLNPISEGQGQVNVPIPKSTKESREAVAKVAAKQAEKVLFCLRKIQLP